MSVFEMILSWSISKWIRC